MKKIKFKENNTIIDVYFSPEEDTVYLGVEQLAKLFNSTISNVVLNIQKIYENGELDEDTTSIVYKYKNKSIKIYNVSVITILGMRMNVGACYLFRKWAYSVIGNSLYVFRKYRKKEGKKNVKHPKLIVDEYDNEYGYMGLTSSRNKGKRHKNIKLSSNPQFKDGARLEESSYLRRKIEYDTKKNFEDISSTYILSERDKAKIKPYVSSKKKKR